MQHEKEREGDNATSYRNNARNMTSGRNDFRNIQSTFASVPSVLGATTVQE